ncbi:MAG: phosphoesterase [Promethearchaeota archaeon]|nr:MAG: phosphoesterase [Candidatus Lokiarchaeota archaeon]
MKLLYVTDIHGVKWKYERILQIAKASEIDIVINGGDMLPTRPNFFIQDEFIENFLDNHFQLYEKEGIHYLFITGNDDLIANDKLINEVADEYDYIQNIAQKLYKINGFEFIGMNWVTDLPFGLKDRARMDKDNFIFPMQIGKAFISTEKGLKKIDDWIGYATQLPTIENELEALKLPENMDKAIYVIHMPPANVLLDVCADKSKVGSEAIYEFLKTHQPLISLHGHIHESPSIYNVWCTKIKDTISIQPGQSNHNEEYLVYVVIDLDSMDLERKRVEK